MAAMIPDLTQVIGFRNVLIHAYGDIDPTEVWGNIQNYLPRLRDAVAELLRSAPGP